MTTSPPETHRLIRDASLLAHPYVTLCLRHSAPPSPHRAWPACTHWALCTAT